MEILFNNLSLASLVGIRTNKRTYKVGYEQFIAPKI